MSRPVHVDRLVPHPANIRENLGDLAALTASIRAQGILQPLVAEPRPDGKYTVLAGHRRLAAARRAGLETVPVTIRPATGGWAKAIEIMLVENCQRRDLGPIEKAEAMGALRELGYTASAIARQLGMVPSGVTRYLSFLELDEGTRERVRDGTVTAAAALRAVTKTRKTTRRARGELPAGRKAQMSGAGFTPRHRLAGEAQAVCDHTTRPVLGGVACGQCWEQVIRADALQPADEPGLGRLTAREERLAVVADLRMAGAGINGNGAVDGTVTARQVAEQLGVSTRTIERYKRDLAGAS